MRAVIFRVGTTELVKAFVEHELTGLVMNSQGAVLEFRPDNTDVKFEDDSRSVRHVMIVAGTYWESLVAYLRQRSQRLSPDPKSSPDDRQLKINGDVGEATIQVIIECHRPSNIVEAIRLFYAGNHATRDLRPNLSRC